MLAGMAVEHVQKDLDPLTAFCLPKLLRVVLENYLWFFSEIILFWVLLQR